MTTPADDLPSVYRFADLTLDPVRRRVTRQNQPIELKSLDFDLLRFLVESAPNVVNPDVLAEKVWGRHFVSPENVAQRVMLLRQSLTDDANRPRYIETVRNKGYRLIPVAERVTAEGGALSLRRGLRLRLVAAGLLLAAGLTAAGYWLPAKTERRAPLPGSVAVLPFENLSPRPEDAYFALGMQDEIVSQLTKVSELSVIPVRPDDDDEASFSALMRGLDVATTLGGSVYYSEGRVRVTPRLTQVTTGVSLWSKSYERDRGDVFAVQSEIALDVARELSVKLSAAERERVQRVPTTHPQARHLYLMARARNPTTLEVLLAIDEVEQALALDPDFIEALWLNSISRTGYAVFLDPQHADEHRRRGEQAARRALELDPQFGDAHAALALVLQGKRDWIGAEKAFREAANLNTPLGRLGSYAFLRLTAGKIDALPRAIFEEALAADPRNALYYRFIAFVHEGLADVAEANGFYETSSRLFPDGNREALLTLEQKMHWLVGRKQLAAASTLGISDPLNASMLASLEAPDRDRALGELRSAYDSMRKGNPNVARTIGLWAGHFGDPMLALAAMRAAIDEQSAQATYLWLPQLTAMRRLPEFNAYMREIGLVDYWREYGWPEFCRERADGHDFECA
jgi:TolB-like protein/DNA-binding winged helix-turn-helix (wHTH) protein/tetratricopeptide (TPR) repeat protein